MNIQLVNISIPEVFERYSEKYHIYKELHEYDLKGLEIRQLDQSIAIGLKTVILERREFCYLYEANDGAIDLLAIGNYSKLKEISKDIIYSCNEEIGLKTNRVFHNIANYGQSVLRIGEKEFSLRKTLLMGILNVTPDSFSDGGKFVKSENALKRVDEFIKNGFDIIDVGGESTRPGSNPVDEKEELNRVIPVVEGILTKYPNAIVSIDTTKSVVARKALQSGAKIINDISAMSADRKMVEIAVEFNAPSILMHMKGNPANMQLNPEYSDVISEIYDFLSERVEFAEKEGIEQIIIDPGIGFGKRVGDNYEIIKRLDEFKGIGRPILIGLSRKSFLGKSLDLPVDKRDFPSGIAETVSVLNGAKIIRTHNPDHGKIIRDLSFGIENPAEMNV